MKKKINRFLALLIVSSLSLFPWACGKFGQQPPGGNPGGVNVFLNLVPLGFFPNRIRIKDNFAYIVNSGSNNIQRINLISGEVDPSFVILPAGSNPWDLAISGDMGYVTNFITNTVSVFDLASGGFPTETIESNAFGSLITPEGITASVNGFVFVANPNLDFSNGSQFGPGFVTVIDSTTNTIVNEIPTTQQNPQFVHAVGNTVYVTNSGEFQFDLDCFCFIAETDGGLDIIDATQADTANAPDLNIPIPLDAMFENRGIPGGFAPTTDGNFAYLGSNSGIMYKVDLVNNTLLRGNSNPIFVTKGEPDNLIVTKTDPAGFIWVLSFNEDKVYFLDPSTDQIEQDFVSLDSDPNNLEGPIDLDFYDFGFFPDAYVVMTLSEFLSAIITI